MNTFRCDCCGTIVDRPAIEITRIDGFGGASIEVDPDRPHHMCQRCAQAIYAGITLLRRELAQQVLR